MHHVASNAKIAMSVHNRRYKLRLRLLSLNPKTIHQFKRNQSPNSSQVRNPTRLLHSYSFGFKCQVHLWDTKTHCVRYGVINPYGKKIQG